MIDYLQLNERYYNLVQFFHNIADTSWIEYKSGFHINAGPYKACMRFPDFHQLCTQSLLNLHDPVRKSLLDFPTAGFMNFSLALQNSSRPILFSCEWPHESQVLCEHRDQPSKGCLVPSVGEPLQLLWKVFGAMSVISFEMEYGTEESQ